MSDTSAAFQERLRTAFDAIEVGQTFTWRRTLTDGDLALFCGVTGDYNPYHLDETFAAESWFGRRIVPGLLTASMLTHIGGTLGFLASEMSFQYLKPVFVGDTITCTVTISEKDEQRRRMVGRVEYVNQDEAVVLQGQFTGFPALVPLAR